MSPDCQGCPLSCVVWCSDHPWCVQPPYPLFFPAVGAFMHLDTSGIYAQIFHGRIRRQRTKHLLQRAVVTPLCKAGIHRLPGTVSLRQLPPLSAASSDPQHPIQHRSVIFSGTPSLPCCFRWQQRLNSFSVFLCQFISFHASIVAPFSLCAVFIFHLISMANHRTQAHFLSDLATFQRENHIAGTFKETSTFHPACATLAVTKSKEPLIKSRLTDWHTSRLHLFRQSAQLSLSNREIDDAQSVHPNKKSDCAICALDLISASLINCCVILQPQFGQT